MAYQNHKHHNRNHYGWWCPSNEYQVYEATEEPAYPRHHHHDVAYSRTNYEEPIAEVEVYSKAREPEINETIMQRYQRARLGDRHAFESVDQEAEAFIKIEHKRMDLSI